jgi:hypothetical protein
MRLKSFLVKEDRIIELKKVERENPIKGDLILERMKGN